MTRESRLIPIFILAIYASVVFLFLIIGKSFSTALSALNLSSDTLLIALGVNLLILTSWSYAEARSQRKFFVKKSIQSGSTDHSNSYRLSSTFLVNVLGHISAVVLWVITPDQFFIKFGMITFGLVLVVAMLTVEIFVRLFMTMYLFKKGAAQSGNSLKFVFVELVVIYGVIISFWATIVAKTGAGI